MERKCNASYRYGFWHWNDDREAGQSGKPFGTPSDPHCAPPPRVESLRLEPVGDDSGGCVGLIAGGLALVVAGFFGITRASTPVTDQSATSNSTGKVELSTFVDEVLIVAAQVSDENGLDLVTLICESYVCSGGDSTPADYSFFGQKKPSKREAFECHAKAIRNHLRGIKPSTIRGYCAYMDDTGGYKKGVSSTILKLYPRVHRMIYSER